mmetsp:Transcript_24432/g.44831  ORF Transcript_24432/g.44831 Transcript_24432/m.44831 type:complete len:203 (-) Transcript_24432:78-686(-)
MSGWHENKGKPTLFGFQCCCYPAGEQPAGSHVIEINKISPSDREYTNDSQSEVKRHDRPDPVMVPLAVPRDIADEEAQTAYNDALKGAPAGPAKAAKVQHSFQAVFRPKEGEVFGGDISHGINDDKGLCQIKAVKEEGLFAQWNASHPEEQIEDLIFITDINGKPMEFIDIKEMVHLFQMTEVVIGFSKKRPTLTRDMASKA